MPVKKPLRLSRRTLLRGAGGAVVGLPLLECMLDGRPAGAQTAAAPRRYLVVFDGQSLGGDDDTLLSQFVPDTVGANYDLKTALAPLGAAGVQPWVTVVSGMRIPTAAENGGTPPAGGRADDFHVSSASPLLSGVRSPSSNGRVYGPTSDQLMAAQIGASNTFKSLVYRAQAAWYLSVSAPYGRDLISYKTDSSGSVVPIPAEVSPRQAFTQLFGNFVPPGVDPATAAAMDFQLRTRRSVLDLVHQRTARLLPQLGLADQQRLQRHFDEIRDLEVRVAATPPPQTSTCVKPGDPGPDPSLGGNQGVDGSGNTTYDQNLGYSNEEDRAKTFVGLIHMAMVCDLTRVASLQLTMFQSHMNMYALTSQGCDLHEVGHFGAGHDTTAQMAKGQAWHVKHFASLVSKFASTPEPGGTMMDNTAMLFLLEGGHGFDPGSGKTWSSHSTENMACLVAGKVGGLKAGQHLKATGMHPAQVLLTAMRAAGYSGSSLGEVSGEIPGLRG